MTSKQLTYRVREILLREWDPCGVGDNPNLNSEYDEYAPKVTDFLLHRSNVGVEEIAAFLAELERDFGLSLPRDQRERTAQALLAALKEGGFH